MCFPLFCIEEIGRSCLLKNNSREEKHNSREAEMGLP